MKSASGKHGTLVRLLPHTYENEKPCLDYESVDLSTKGGAETLTAPVETGTSDRPSSLSSSAPHCYAGCTKRSPERRVRAIWSGICSQSQEDDGRLYEHLERVSGSSEMTLSTSEVG